MKILSFLTIFSSFLFANTLPLPPLQEAPPQEFSGTISEKNKSAFLHLSFSLIPLPTTEIGYRMLYNRIGSDIALSVTLLPWGCCHETIIIPLPGITYKQLFFCSKPWQNVSVGHSSFYLGARLGIYPLVKTYNAGALAGWQFRHKNRSSYFEMSCNPLLLAWHEFNFKAPLASLTYGILF